MAVRLCREENKEMGLLVTAEPRNAEPLSEPSPY